MSECTPTPAKPIDQFGSTMADIFEAVARYNSNTTMMTMHAHVCQTPNCPAMNQLHQQGANIMDQVVGHIEQLRKSATEIRDARLMMISKPSTSTN